MSGVRLARAWGGVPVGFAVLTAAAGVGGALFAGKLPDPVLDDVKTLAPRKDGKPHEVKFSRWSPVFRIDVLPGFGALMLIHDGTVGSAMHKWDGNIASLSRFDKDDRLFPFRLLKPHPKVAIIGAAGGHEILASLWFDVEHVTGIELNPVTYSLLRTHFADYTGHLTENPRVTHVNAEGRSYIKGSGDIYDLIWFVAPDSYAAMNAATSGAFVLSESYLYTAEMIVDSLKHLSDDGLVCAQFGEVDFAAKPNRTLRYLLTAREAFRRLGITAWQKHVLVATAPGFGTMASTTILLRKKAFTAADAETFHRASAQVPQSQIHHDTLMSGEGVVGQVMRLQDEPAVAAWLETYPWNVEAITDDAPFFWHFVDFSEVMSQSLHVGTLSPEEGLGEKLLLVMLVVAVVFAALFLLAPLALLRGIWGQVPYKLPAGIYFAALGLGFMFLEVALIQHLTLFVGYPTYSLTVTLFALLLSTGVGSVVSESVATRRNASLMTLGGVLVLLVGAYHLGIPVLVEHGIGLPLAVRLAIAVAILFPLGVCLGVLMPVGLRTVAAVTQHGEEFVAWSWAVNGFFSVVSSVLSTILSMTIGFNAVMLLAVAIYWIGFAALMRIPAPATAR